MRRLKSLNVTCEVQANIYPSLTNDLREYNPAFKMAPPIRSEDHRQALLEGLKDGTIDAIITDHTPHAFEEKDHEFCCAPNALAVSRNIFGSGYYKCLRSRINLALIELCTI